VSTEILPFDESTAERARAIVARYPRSGSALLPMLHLVQSVQGYVSRDGIEFCARQLDLTAAQVSAVATFYSMYKREPCGQHLVSVCTNTMCAMLGGDEIYRRLAQRLGNGAPLGHEETVGTPGASGSVTLEHVECLAACDFAPVLQVDYEFYDNQTPDSAVDLVDALRRGERPAPTRGAPLTSFRSTELALAGFFEGEDSLESTVTGSAQANETNRGARIAVEREWTAPAMPEDVQIPEPEETA
jgi:NADH-quinone oxidoreductase subunit E